MSQKSHGKKKPPAPHKTNPKAAAAFAQAIAWHQQGQLEQAESYYRKTLERDAKHTDAIVNMGLIHLQRKDYEQGIDWISRSLKIDPRQPDALSNLGVAQAALKNYASAVDAFTRAIALNPDDPVLYNNRGGALKDMYLQHQAIADFTKAIALAPDYAGAYNNRGLAFSNLRENDLALADFDKAIALDPYHVLAYRHKGLVLHELKRFSDAIESYQKVLELQPDTPLVLGNLFSCQQYLCDWQHYSQMIGAISDALAHGKKSITPFTFLSVPSTPSQQQVCARLFTRDMQGQRPWISEKQNQPDGKKIRIGYFSPDFRHHAVTHLVAGLIECHDRNQFEVYGFNIGPVVDDPWRKRMEKAFDHFHDVLEKSNDEVVTLARDIGLDLAIDLTGYTQFSRTEIFAQRLAPLQIQYLGYVGTMGASFIDYTIADAIVIPEQERQFFDEKVIYLPHTYQINDDKKHVSEREFSRTELGLPENAFVFCSHNSHYKITPDAFDIWMRVLKKVEGSVLWLLKGPDETCNNLRNAAASRGIDPDRLIFAENLGHAEYLVRFRAADLFLDTLYYNAGTTASDALWAGLPVLAYRGNTYVSRMAASLLNAVGLPELVTDTPQEYEELAVRLATNPDELAAHKHKLAENRTTHPLFNTELTTRHIEQGYIRAYERYRSGLPPEHIFVQP